MKDDAMAMRCLARLQLLANLCSNTMPDVPKTPLLSIRQAAESQPRKAGDEP